MKKEMQSLKRKCKRYMQKNRDMISFVDELKSKATEPRETQIAAQEEDKTNLQHLNIIQNENEMTPLSKSNSYVEQNLPHIVEEDKEKVKKHLFTYNVLVNAIQDTYENTEKNSERNILKRIVKNKCMTKYVRKSVITRSVLGLKGSARQRKMIKKNNSIEDEIIKFYNRDDVSRATAGKKEFKTQGKIKKQRRYLLDTLKELYKKYRAEGGRAKLTCFKKYRPYYVIPPKLSDRETCSCVKHENILMKIKKLTSLGMIETTNLNDTLSIVVCNLDSKACAYGECLTCCNKCIEFNKDTCDKNEIVTWDEFATQEHEYINKNDGKMSTTKKVVKKEVHDKLKALTSAFNEDLKMMKKHVFNIKHQYAQYLSCITNLKSNEVAIHIDFSENYLCKLSTEVQSMHFGASKPQVTLHTGVLYVKGKKPQSFGSVSACNDHTPEAIWGMGFPYSTWNFSEAGHDKGAADGVGGALKRRLDDLVKHGTDIPDAHTAYTLIKNSDTAIMIFYIREDDIAKNSVEEDLVPVPQTMMLHQICNTDKTNVIRFRFLSCFCDAPQRGYCECFEVKNHCLVKTFTKENKSQRSPSFLKRKTTEDDTRQRDEGIKKTKVTVLSDIRYRVENMGYDNLQNYRPFKLKRMKKITKDFVLTNSGKENIDYDNPVPSTSGTRIKHVKQSTVNEIQGKKIVKRYSNDSSTDEDDQFSLHDSSDDNFYDELLSDTTGEENNKVNKKYTDTVIGEKQDNCDFTRISTTDEVKNANENVTDKNKDNVVPEKVEKEKFDMTMITDTSSAGNLN
ncbi:unnamed protein product [Diatraea saccharalis]|uniref:Uncharacterized protein n=1 Tax=Diatraea saccharalis TaxID=40085 RepID=A0A9N9WD08_9NEOP|nr:unnamed protein product [Diatraea saccharalis]